MAKNQSSLNYGPDTALILGERDVRKAQAALTLAPGQGLVAGVQAFLSQEAKMQQADNKKDSDDHQKWLETLEDPSSVYKLSNAKDKQISLNWLRGKRQQYLQAKKLYKQTGNYEYEDKANMLASHINNFVSQTNSYNETQAEYADASHHFGKANGTNAPKYIYQGNRDMLISDDGNINFSITDPEYLVRGGKGNELVSYNKVGQKWNVRNQTAETFISDKVEGIFNDAAVKGPAKHIFSEQKTFSDFYSHLSDRDKYGPENSMVLAETDISADDAYITNDFAKGFSFSQMWESGLLNEKYYKGFEPTGVDSKTGLKTYDNSWMFDEKNSDQLNRSLAYFYTDVAIDRDIDGKLTYELAQENLSEQELEQRKKQRRADKQIDQEFEKPDKLSEKDKQLQRLEDNWNSLTKPKGKSAEYEPPTPDEVISFYRNNINQSHELRYYNQQEAEERSLPRGAGYYRVISGDLPDTPGIETFYLDFIAESFNIPLLKSLYEQNQ
jgi:hypothetical protein